MGTCTRGGVIDNVTGRNARIASGIRIIWNAQLPTPTRPGPRGLGEEAACRRAEGWQSKTKTPNRDTASRDHTCGMLIHNKKLRTWLHFLPRWESRKPPARRCFVRVYDAIPSSPPQPHPLVRVSNSSGQERERIGR